MRDENKNSPALSSKLITLFVSLVARFRPVMRHFFTEKHKTPMSWFAMRLNYTRSVATTSIVGHILGLGDRHTSNILLDSSTGEVVHIDLGIAFEQVSFFLRPPRETASNSRSHHNLGQVAPHPRMRAVPDDGRHGRRHGHDGHPGRLPALRRGNAARAAGGLRGDPDRARSLQIRPTPLLVPSSLLFPS